MFNQDEIMHEAYMEARNNLRKKGLSEEEINAGTSEEMKKVLRENGYSRFVHLV